MAKNKSFDAKGGIKGAVPGILILMFAFFKYLREGSCSGDCGNFVFMCISCQSFIIMGLITTVLGYTIMGYMSKYMR